MQNWRRKVHDHMLSLMEHQLEKQIDACLCNGMLQLGELKQGESCAVDFFAELDRWKMHLNQNSYINKDQANLSDSSLLVGQVNWKQVEFYNPHNTYVATGQTSAVTIKYYSPFTCIWDWGKVSKMIDHSSPLLKSLIETIIVNEKKRSITTTKVSTTGASGAAVASASATNVERQNDIVSPHELYMLQLAFSKTKKLLLI